MIRRSIRKVSLSYYFLLSLLLGSCAHNVAVANTDVAAINRGPKEFNGQKVTLTGILMFSSEGTLLYSSCAFREAVLIDDSSTRQNAEFLSTGRFQLQGKEVTLTGTVDASAVIPRSRNDIVFGGHISLKNVDLALLRPNKDATGGERSCDPPQ